jgi:hypothetical protein
MPVQVSNKLNFTLKPDTFNDFVSKIDDLCRISDTIKLKIDSESILMYSMMGSENIILAFKNYDLKTDEYFNIKEDLEYTLNIIITSAKKFVKNLAFIKQSEKILFEVTHKFVNDDDTVSDARTVQIKNGKFKLQIQTGENSEIRDLNRSSLAQRMNLKNKKWTFTVNNSDFNDIKKLATINSDDSRRILHLNIEDYKVKLSEVSLWELEVDEVTENNKHFMFNKSFLPCINDSGKPVQFHVFETFILVKDDISNLMISFEQSFEDD